MPSDRSTQPWTRSLNPESASSAFGPGFRARQHQLRPSGETGEEKAEIMRPRCAESRHYVRFGRDFYLHPKAFVLAITLEWIRLPANLGAYVIGKSSWGRRGLVIATATGVHPGFTGCLTLELSNLGEIPIAITPGMHICKIFLYEVAGDASDRPMPSQFSGSRKPSLGSTNLDVFAKKLIGLPLDE
jgi:deoxycytidine triphosphate deaminase